MRPQGTHFEGPEESLSCVQCFLYLVSSSINVSIFDVTWLNTYMCAYIYTHILYIYRERDFEKKERDTF